MKLQIILLLSMVFAVCPAYSDDAEKLGKEILDKADQRFYPYEGTWECSFSSDDAEGTHTEYKMQGYKKGRLNQTFVITSPEINKNDVGMRSGDTIYYKQNKWPKPSITSCQSMFMESSFSFGDVISSDIALDYKAAKIDKIKEAGKDVYVLVLHPKKAGLYARIDTWIDADSYNTYKRLYYTASGEKLKVALFEDIEVKNGQVVSFKVFMEDYIMETKTIAVLSNIKKESLPRFLFDPQNIGRIHMR